MKRLSLRQKEYFERRNDKLQRIYSKRKRKSPQKTYKNHQKTTLFSPPSPIQLGFINNPEGTISYFNKFLDLMRKKAYNYKFYFDLSNIEEISIDAIMYMLAIVRNIRGTKTKKYSFAGSIPLKSELRSVFEESGFYSYVNYNNTSYRINPVGNKIKIKCGKDSNPEVAQSICDFVMNKCKCEMIDIRELYIVLMELIPNTVQHAYGKEHLLNNEWYVFVEDSVDRIKFVFLDTGEGIPRTVAKTIKEFFKDVLLAGVSDSSLIKSALLGEYRTQTKKTYRGKGLPRVMKAFTKGNLQNLCVYSGRGFCKLNSNETIEAIDYKQEMIGTLYSWEYCKTIEE